MKLDEIVHRGRPSYILDSESRNKLLINFPPKYPDVIAHHVTYLSKITDELPPEAELAVVGYVDDGNGLEALVVSANGSVRSPDNRILHITWSLDRAKGRKPVESNEVLSKLDYIKIKPIKIIAIPDLYL